MNKYEQAIHYLKPIADSASDKMSYGEMLNITIEALEQAKENESLRARFEKQTVYLRNVSGWCSGCKHFKSLGGCAIGKMEACTDCFDLYESKF